MPLTGSIPLVLVSGFLGSGKTTFLNNLFNNFPGRRFGIIVNDFGALGVDAAAIKGTAGSIVTELNNGQIFCSCLAGSFIDSVSAYSDRDIDYLLVETSGLAKPSPLIDIIDGIKRLSSDRFSYYGMISLVDGSTYLKLSEVLKAVDEQIAYSDIVLINKTDLTDARTLKEAEMKILTVNPGANIIRTEYGRMPSEYFLGMQEKETVPGPDRMFSGWGRQGRPVPVILKSDKPVRYADLESFIENPGGDYFRIKGWVTTDQGPAFADCTVSGGSLVLSDFDVRAEEGLVVILPADNGVVEAVKSAAAVIFNTVE